MKPKYVVNLYANRDHKAQGDYFVLHMDRMTGEALHNKSDIAAELAHRDIEIANLQAEIAALKARLEAVERLPKQWRFEVGLCKTEVGLLIKHEVERRADELDTALAGEGE